MFKSEQAVPLSCTPTAWVMMNHLQTKRAMTIMAKNIHVPDKQMPTVYMGSLPVNANLSDLICFAMRTMWQKKKKKILPKGANNITVNSLCVQNAHALHLQIQTYSKRYVSQVIAGNTAGFFSICYSNIHSTDCIKNLQCARYSSRQ